MLNICSRCLFALLIAFFRHLGWWCYRTTEAKIGLISIYVNGEPTEVPDNLKLPDLLEWLKLPGDRVAVERNLEIVPRDRWPETRILPGDRLEVVHFVGGGRS